MITVDNVHVSDRWRGQATDELLVLFYPGLFGLLNTVSGDQLASLDLAGNARFSLTAADPEDPEVSPGQHRRLRSQDLAKHVMRAAILALAHDGYASARLGRHLMLRSTMIAPLHRDQADWPAGLANELLADLDSEQTVAQLVYRWFGAKQWNPELDVACSVAAFAQSRGFLVAAEEAHQGVFGRPLPDRRIVAVNPDLVAPLHDRAVALAAQYESIRAADSDLFDHLLTDIGRGLLRATQTADIPSQ